MKNRCNITSSYVYVFNRRTLRIYKMNGEKIEMHCPGKMFHLKHKFGLKIAV